MMMGGSIGAGVPVRLLRDIQAASMDFSDQVAVEVGDACSLEVQAAMPTANPGVVPRSGAGLAHLDGAPSPDEENFGLLGFHDA